MNQIARDAFDEATRHALFRQLGIDPAQLTDLGGFESFVFSRRDRGSIVRFTHTSHRTLDQVLAELDWIDFLAREGGAVCTPLRQKDGSLACARGDFVVCEFSRAPGRPIDKSDWQPGLFIEWGRCIGQFHHLTRQYVPAVGPRPDCTVDPNFDLQGLVPDQPLVLARAREVTQHFMAQPRSDSNFGLIHSDAHAGNFFTDNGRLVFFDFDDACYCWFAYDIATILLSAVLQQWIGDTQAEREAAAREFLPHFLEGYAGTCEVAPPLLEQLPLCLKFREICLYGVICRYVTPEERDCYTDKFMAGRRGRIERDEPYLALDFL